MKSDTEYLRLTMEIAKESRAAGNHPFGALLVGPEGEVLISSGNTFARDRGVGHAEVKRGPRGRASIRPCFPRAMHAGDLGRAVLHVLRGVLLGWHRYRGVRAQ